LALLLVLVVLGALFVSACGGTASSPSGARGRALIVGGPAPGSPRPEPGVWVAVHAGPLAGPIVAKARATSDGSFSFDLSPGTYTLVEVSSAAMPRTVVVKPGQYAPVTLVINAR
jgi:hypothetical protein